MTSVKTDRFEGILPRIPESMLPDHSATVAQNCEFAYGELRGIKGDFAIRSLGNAPASVYTENGLTFFSFTGDTDAVRSPLANDTFNRLYYTGAGDFRVTTRAGMNINGGAPGSSYRVGVPRPSTAPVLTLPNAADITGSSLTTKFHYEYGGQKYDEQVIGLFNVVLNKQWTATIPARSASTPVQAFPVIRMTAAAFGTNEQTFDIYSSNSSFSDDTDWVMTLSPPTSGSTYNVTLASKVKDGEKETRAYVYTYVNTYNEEGPPSPPATITSIERINPNVGVYRDAQSAPYAPIKEIRIYRTPTGAEIADYFYVGAIPALSGGPNYTFIDAVKAAELNEPLSSDEYYPPNPALTNLMRLPNGILCGMIGNELHFCEPYKAWAWPPRYVKTFADTLVGGLAHGSGALITTLGMPFFISGVSSDSMTESEVGTPQAGLNKWALAKLGTVLVYASNDGLVAISGNQASMNLSERYFTRDVWRERYQAGFSSMRFAVWDGRLIVFSSVGAFPAFMIRFDESTGSMTELPNFSAQCAFTSQLSDQCYFMRGNQLYQFAGGPELAAVWQSREIVFPKPVNFGIAQVICSGSWSLAFYADGVLSYTKALTGSDTFRLPSGFRAERWKFKVTGTGRMREIRIAETANELGKL